ncbi:MAG: hypothetical protein V3S42_04565 [Candidatus Neomarinimicrobiota bacterium]
MNVKFTAKINFRSLGIKFGDIIDTNCDQSGNPKDTFWSRRLLDGCIEPYKKKIEKSKPKPEKSEGEKS